MIHKALIGIGVNPQGYRRTALQRRLPACLRVLRAGDTRKAFDLLERFPAAAELAANALLLGVSEFFRDTTVFRQLGSELLLDLLADGRELNVLSAGCSEGQELYSVAMLVDQLESLSRCHFVGVDCRASAINAARRGIYRSSEIQAIPQHLRTRYLRPTSNGHGFQVVSELRNRTQWQLGDLLEESLPKAAWDVILFRNVGIYFETQAYGRTLRRLVEALRPNGILVTGKAERPPDVLRMRRVGQCLYRKNPAN